MVLRIIFWSVLFGLIFALGWTGSNVYEDYTNQRIYNGLYLEGYTGYGKEATLNKLENTGDWVCVNVRGMSFEEAFETCRHEVGHEVFAEFCDESEINFKKCMEVEG